MKGTTPMNNNDRRYRRNLRRALKTALLRSIPTKRLYINIATPFVLSALLLVCVALPLAGMVAISGCTIMGIYNAIPYTKEIIQRKKVIHNDNLNRS